MYKGNYSAIVFPPFVVSIQFMSSSLMRLLGMYRLMGRSSRMALLHIHCSISDSAKASASIVIFWAWKNFMMLGSANRLTMYATSVRSLYSLVALALVCKKFFRNLPVLLSTSYIALVASPQSCILTTALDTLKELLHAVSQRANLSVVIPPFVVP